MGERASSRDGWVGYAVSMAVNGGSELLIFVRPKPTDLVMTTRPSPPYSRSGCISSDKRRSACRAGTSGQQGERRIARPLQRLRKLAEE